MIDFLCKYSVLMVLVIDCNPGFLFLIFLLLIMNMGCMFFCMIFEEVLVGVMKNVVLVLGFFDCGIFVKG